MKRILKFIFNLIIVFTVLSSTAQDSTKSFKISSAGIQFDLSNIVVRFFDPEINSYSLLGDIKFNRNLFVNFEAGAQDYIISKSFYDYELNGWYAKLGIGRNIVKSPESDYASNGFICMRYGFGQFRQKAGNIHFINTYWGEKIINLPEEKISKHWLEFGGGLSGELLRNLYLGWAFYLRLSLFGGDYKIITPEHIPGYGNGFNKLNASFHYYLSYRISFD